MSFNSSPRFSISALPGRERFLLAATVTGTKLRLFINGRQVTEGSPPAPVSISDLNSVYLGLSPGASPNFRAYDAPLHRFRLSRGERYSADYDPAREWLPDEQTLVLYDFRRGGTADQVLDLSANKKHGKLVNAKWVSAIGSANSPKMAPESSEVRRVHDLLKLVDVSRDAGVGNWKRIADGVACENPNGANVLQLPYEPPEEYDFEIEFTTTGSGLNVNQYVAASGQMFAWKLNSHNVSPPLYGFELLDGKFAKDNKEAATQIPTPIKDGQRYRSTIEVRRGSLRTLLDGKELVKWTGDFKRLSLEPVTPMKHPGRIGIGSWRRPVTFHSATVREISGTGKLLAVAPASVSPNNDLLSKIDVARDGVGNSWKIEKGALHTIAGPNEGDRRLYLPINDASPPDEYDIRLKVQRVSARDNALMLGLVSGRHRVGLVLDGFKSRGGLWGLEQIDGKGPQENGTAIPNEPLKVDVPAEVLVQVRKTGIRVERDGKQLIHWVGSADKLSLNVKWDDKGPPRFFLGAQGDFLIHRLTFEPVQSSETNWLDLFNGKDLAGWKVMGFNGWTVENGTLLGKTTATGGNGWLMSDREFTDYELELEYKLGPGSNSGIFLRAWPEGDVSGKGFREIQLLDDESPSFAWQPAKNRTGSLFGLVAPDVAPKVPTNQWHRVRVRLQGQQLQLTINDVSV